MKCIITVLAGLISATSATAAVTSYGNKLAWQGAVDYSFTTIDFTGWPPFTIIQDQYMDIGISFTDPDAYIDPSGGSIDGAMLARTDWTSGIGTLHMSFSAPQFWIATDYLGSVVIELYSSGNIIYTSPFFGFAPLFA